MAHRHQFHQLEPCGVRGVDSKGEIEGFARKFDERTFRVILGLLNGTKTQFYPQNTPQYVSIYVFWPFTSNRQGDIHKYRLVSLSCTHNFHGRS